MTTILFKETEKGVQIAFDSQVSTGYMKEELEFPKVFANGDLIFGVAGAVRDANILKYAELEQPDFNERAEPDRVDCWVTNRLIPSIAKVLSNQKATEVSDQYMTTNNHTLVVVAGRVYKIGGDLSWVRSTSGIYAVGSGAKYALGALAAGAGLKKAIQAAASLDSGTGYTLYKTSASELVGNG